MIRYKNIGSSISIVLKTLLNYLLMKYHEQVERKNMENKKRILEKLYDDFLKEKESVQKEIDEYFNKITEANSYIDSIIGIEDSDFKVFSPRDVESIYKESLAKHRNLKKEYENDYQNRIRKREIIDSRLKKIEYLLLNSGEDMEVLDIQEKERQRIARDLHDSSLQNLTHSIHKIELVSLYIDKDPIQAKLELAALSKNIKEVIDEIRGTIFDLRPMQFDDLGFKDSVEQLINKVKKEFSTNIVTDIDDIDIDNKCFLMTIFRVVQECINNAVKHSNSELLQVKIKENDNCFDISIIDDGEGFEMEEILCQKAKRHFGLMILEERVNNLHGNIDIKSTKDKGTNIHIQFPLNYLKGED